MDSRTVAIVMLAIIISIFGTMYIVEGRKTRMSQSMVEEFILQQRSERALGQLTMLPNDRGVFVRNEVIYGSNPEIVKAALERGSGAQQQQRQRQNALASFGALVDEWSESPIDWKMDSETFEIYNPADRM